MRRANYMESNGTQRARRLHEGHNIVFACGQVKHCDLRVTFVSFVLLISSIATAQSPVKPLILKSSAFKHYVDYFNNMEEENIKQAIPNDSAWSWMQKNIPLFECPQQNFEEIFYYRWWTLRKHIKKTEKGFVFTEFLVHRTYPL